jgi:hypothetical protein
MAGKQTPEGKKVHLYPPPSKDFDPFAATEKDLMRHGLPLRPDPQTQPGMAALWERQAARYRSFDHLEPRPDTTTAAKKAVTGPALGPHPIESCGYQLFSSSAPFTALFVTWTVPDLHFTPSPIGVNHFHTFVGLGFLDVHVAFSLSRELMRGEHTVMSAGLSFLLQKRLNPLLFRHGASPNMPRKWKTLCNQKFRVLLRFWCVMHARRIPLLFKRSTRITF